MPLDPQRMIKSTNVYESIVFYPSFSTKKARPILHESAYMQQLDLDVTNFLKEYTKEDLEKVAVLFWNQSSLSNKIPIPVTRKGKVSPKNFFHPEHVLYQKDDGQTPIPIITEAKIEDVVKQYMAYAQVAVDYSKQVSKVKEALASPAYLAYKQQLKAIYHEFLTFEQSKMNKLLTIPTSLQEDIQAKRNILHSTFKNKQTLNRWLNCKHTVLKWSNILEGNPFMECATCKLPFHFNVGEVDMPFQHLDLLDFEKTLQNMRAIQNMSINEDQLSSRLAMLSEVAYKLDDMQSVVQELYQIIHINQSLSPNQGGKSNSPLVLELNSQLNKQKVPKRKPKEPFNEWIERCQIDSFLTFIKQEPHDDVPIDKLILQIYYHYDEFLEDIQQTLNNEQNKLEKMAISFLPEVLMAGSVTLTKELTLKLLSFVKEMDGRFGITTYAEVLAGAKTDKMKKYNLIQNPYYGFLSQYSQSKVLGILRSLENDYELTYREGYDYPKYVLTIKGETVVTYTTLSSEGKDVVQNHLLDMTFKRFIECMPEPTLLEKWKEEYLDEFFKTNESDAYKVVFDAIQYVSDPLSKKLLKKTLVKYYDVHYQPIFDFYQTFKKNTKTGKFINEINQVIHESKEHV